MASPPKTLGFAMLRIYPFIYCSLVFFLMGKSDLMSGGSLNSPNFAFSLAVMFCTFFAPALGQSKFESAVKVREICL